MKFQTKIKINLKVLKSKNLNPRKTLQKKDLFNNQVINRTKQLQNFNKKSRSQQPLLTYQRSKKEYHQFLPMI